MLKIKILVVEDETLIAINLQNSLETLGYNVPFIVATGEDAIRLTDKESFDLLLMDIVLPGEIDGIEAANQIHSKHDVPVIYLTAYSDDQILQRAKITEPLAYIIKPFENRELHSAIQMALYKHNMERERERLKLEIVSRNKELEQVLYVTTHDLRSPLVNIQGFSQELDFSIQELESITRNISVRSDDEIKINAIIRNDIPNSLQSIKSSVTKIDSLISGLLSLSRLGQAEFQQDRINMNSLITDVTKTFEFQIKEKGVKLELSDLPYCIGDEFHINRLFSNLLENALKFLTTERSGFIKISGHEKAGMSLYCIEDNGIGIAPENQGKIFDIFHQLKPSIKGDGLGLSIIKKIVNRYHGKIWVESEPGKGSKFFLSLPHKNQCQ